MNRRQPAAPILAAVLAAALLLPAPVVGGSRRHRPAPGATPEVVLGATVETDPVPHDGDAADDPAIWVHPTDPSLSLIIGTDKQGGLAVYDLSGKQLQYIAQGMTNNVDLRENFPLGGQAVALVVASNPHDNSLAVYRVNPATRRLETVAGSPIRTGSPVHGLCMYRSRARGTYYVFAVPGKRPVEQWELVADGRGRVGARKVRTLSLATPSEGCVADDELGHLYLAEEKVGIWKYGAEPDAGETRTLVDSTGPGGHLTADVEGLALYAAGGGIGYLIASSQGSDSFVVYRREADNAYLVSFAIGASQGIDAVEHTDGIEATSAGLGPAFPHGLFVAQDGRNDAVGHQNFKLVPWDAIADAARARRAADTSRAAP